MSHAGVGAALPRTGFADLPSDCACSLSDLRGLTRQTRVIDGRPHFAKLSIDDGKQVKIAAIDPDFG